MKQLSSILLALALTTFAGITSAVPITGTVEFDGGYTTDTGDKNTATVFTFINPINVTAATGSFTPLFTAGSVNYSPLDINGLPASPLWSATVGTTNYSYDLNSIQLDTVISGFRLIEGIGTFTIGNDTQAGTWAFSTQGNGSGGVFSFSASQVPEPSIALLLGAGLIGFGVSRKRLKTA